VIRFFVKAAGVSLVAFFALISVVEANPATCADEQAALTYCQNVRKTYNQYQTVTPCSATISADGNTGVYSFQYSNSTWTAPGTAGQKGFVVCKDAPPSNPCAGMAGGSMNYAGKILAGFQYCAPNPQPDGSSVKCGMSASPITPPTSNEWGSWHTNVSMTPTGSICGSGAAQQGGDWTTSAGDAPTDPPPKPPEKPDNNAAPKTCGEVSCYDPNTGNYCTQGSSGTICAKGAPPGSSGGSCASGGDTTVCAGSPDAPKPPPDKVPDPATQTQGHDNYTQANPATGSLSNVGVGTYVSGPGSVSNGAGQNDTKPPASSSSSATPPKSDNGSAGGGGDCNNPPYVEGNAALGVIALQTWKTRCALEDDKADDSDKSLTGAEGVPDGVGDSEQPVHLLPGVDATNLDQTGFYGSGQGRCPTFPSLDIPAFDVHYEGPPPGWCEWIDALGKLILLMAMVWAFFIINGRG
jgi:hypothetical protein